jgi:hypothetical protein
MSRKEKGLPTARETAAGLGQGKITYPMNLFRDQSIYHSDSGEVEVSPRLHISPDSLPIKR